MKLPQYNYDDKYQDELFEACQKAAIQLTIRAGTIVKAYLQPVCPAGGWQFQPFPPPAGTPDPEWEIVFKTMGKTYDTLKEVRKVLKMKAFL